MFAARSLTLRRRYLLVATSLLAVVAAALVWRGQSPSWHRDSLAATPLTIGGNAASLAAESLAEAVRTGRPQCERHALPLSTAPHNGAPSAPAELPAELDEVAKPISQAGRTTAGDAWSGTAPVLQGQDVAGTVTEAEHGSVTTATWEEDVDPEPRGDRGPTSDSPVTDRALKNVAPDPRFSEPADHRARQQAPTDGGRHDDEDVVSQGGSETITAKSASVQQQAAGQLGGSIGRRPKPPLTALADADTLPLPASEADRGETTDPDVEELLPRADPFDEPLSGPDDFLAPELLDRPPADVARQPPDDGEGMLYWAPEPPLGFSGRSSVTPTETQQNSHFVPVEDRWRIGFSQWDRYGQGNPFGADYPFKEGHWWDPFNQNVIKGDYPISGQNTFLNLTAVSLSELDGRQVPTPTTPFESTLRPFQEEFFGDPNQFFYPHFFKLSFDLFHGDAGFKQPDWRIKIMPVFNNNYLAVNELGIVNPDVRRGKNRRRSDWALEEWYIEKKVADLSPDFDILSVRAGQQFFLSDFRGLIFFDINRGVRVFGTRFANRDQFNLIFFDQVEKNTNSRLNTFDDRHQNTIIANYFRQDFIWPGYTGQISFHANFDGPSVEFDRNEFLVRPDPVGVFAPHEVHAYYLGWAGDGHINRFNISHAFYWAFGEDDLNPLSHRRVDINAQLAAIELSYDRDYARFRGSFFWASGDSDTLDNDAKGFDSIFDKQNFAGGKFSYWNRQQIRLFGVALVQDFSLLPDLRSSKLQGQSNFVNPGLFLVNLGFDADITPKLKFISNANYLWFHHTDVLQSFTFQGDIANEIGTDLSVGVEYRPLLNNNIIIEAGFATLLPGAGFEDLYDPFQGGVGSLHAGFIETIIEY